LPDLKFRRKPNTRATIVDPLSGTVGMDTPFNPDLGIYPPGSEPQEDVDETLYRNTVSRIRKQFQNSLLVWLRDSDTGAMHTITGLTQELQGLSRFNSAAQLWWVASAYMDLMALDPVDQDITRRRIPARLDQLLRQLIEEGEAALVKGGSENLIKEMLYAIGMSSCNSTLLLEIRHAFNLDEVLQKIDQKNPEPDTIGSLVNEEIEQFSVASRESTLEESAERIFTRETLGHLSIIRNFLSSESNTVSAELLRAVHTLHGTSRSLHLVEMSNLFHALDEHLAEIHANGVDLSEEEARILDKAAILSAQVLDRLNTDHTFPAALREEFDQLQNSVSRNRKPAALGSLKRDIEAIEQFDVLKKIISRDRPAGPVAPVPPAGKTSSADEDFADLRAVFIDESTDILARINGSLNEWRDGQDQDIPVASVKRELHTLKGSAYAAGFEIMGDLSHHTETLLGGQAKGTPMPGNELRALLEESHDTLSDMIGRIGRGLTLVAPEHLHNRLVDLINAGPDEHAGDGYAGTGSAQGAGQVKEVFESSRKVLRMNTEMLDKLVNYAGELSITRAQMQENLSGLRSSFGDLKNNVERFAGQLRHATRPCKTRVAKAPMAVSSIRCRWIAIPGCSSFPGACLKAWMIWSPYKLISVAASTTASPCCSSRHSSVLSCRMD